MFGAKLRIQTPAVSNWYHSLLQQTRQLARLLASWELLLASVEMFEEEIRLIFQHNMFIATTLLALT